MSLQNLKAFLWVAVGLTVPLIGGQAVYAQTSSEFDAAVVFASSCAPCHGVTGAGDGPVASALVDKLQPLGSLAQRYNGIFPREYVYKIIDGREERRAHGSRVMPVWGSVYGLRHQLEGSVDEPTEAATKNKIDSLVDFIEALQTKSAN